MLFLVDAYTIGANINTICLPPPNKIFDLQRCIVSGWGKDSFGKEGKYSQVLKTVELPIVPKDKCLTELRKAGVGHNYKLHDSFICAGGEPGVDTCEGDGGSPLACPIPNTSNQYHQVGMVSWGIGCGGPTPGTCFLNNSFESFFNFVFLRWLCKYSTIHKLDQGTIGALGDSEYFLHTSPNIVFFI